MRVSPLLRSSGRYVCAAFVACVMMPMKRLYRIIHQIQIASQRVHGCITGHAPTATGAQCQRSFLPAYPSLTSLTSPSSITFQPLLTTRHAFPFPYFAIPTFPLHAMPVLYRSTIQIHINTRMQATIRSFHSCLWANVATFPCKRIACFYPSDVPITFFCDFLASNARSISCQSLNTTLLRSP